MTPIIDYTGYIAKMDKSIPDKCWWYDKIDEDVDTVVDFGCGNGALFDYLRSFVPQITRFIGIDNNEEMRKRATNKNYCYRNTTIISDIDGLLTLHNFDASRAVFVMNSVIHEILTYEGSPVFHNLLQKVDKIGFRYVVIRDMCMPTQNTYIDWLPSLDDRDPHIQKRYLDFCKVVLNYSLFENYTLCDTMLEFLLKYTYTTNWEREKKERYLWHWNDSAKAYLSNNYCINYNSTFCIPQQIAQIRKDFGITADIPSTHRKMLFKRK